MTDEYRIESEGLEFKVIDDAGETVGVHTTLRNAKKEIEAIKEDDLRYESAMRLVKKAIKAHMKMHGVDSRVSRYWIREAAD